MALSDLRKQIDEVDDEILRLFLERQDLSMQVAEYKNAHNIPIVNKQREREILADVTAKSGENERYAYHLFSTLFELSRSRQAELTNAPTRVVEQVSKALKRSSDLFPQTGRVAVQGTEGANSQVACDHLFPRGTIVYCESFDDVVTSVETGACEFGVLPIENSSNGSVREVYNLLRDHRLNIVRSTRQCIRHELLALPGATLDDITEIYSHEQALGQCRKYLSSLKGVKITSCANTAVAAQMVSESGNIHAAAISSHPCRALYGLTCLNDDIQDSDNNYTRFICITKDPCIYAGANRISIIMAVEDRPGSLYEMLGKMAALDISMTKLESCPVPGSDFGFIFFIEMEGSVQDKSVLSMLAEMERCCPMLYFLGNYSEI